MCPCVRTLRSPRGFHEDYDECDDHADVPQAYVAITIEWKMFVQSIPIDHELGYQHPRVEDGKDRGNPHPERELVECDPLHDRSSKISCGGMMGQSNGPNEPRAAAT